MQKAIGPHISSSIKRILAIRMGHIGDVVLMTPGLELLNQLFPGSEISVLVRSGTEPMLQNHPFVKEIHVGGQITSNQRLRERTKASLWQRVKQMPSGWRLVRQLRRQHFDLAVDFTGGDRSAILTFLSGAGKRVGYAAQGNLSFIKNRLYTHTCPKFGNLHKVQKDVELLRTTARAVGREDFIACEPGPLVLKCSGADLLWAQTGWSTWTARKHGPRIVVHPTSRVRYKCWEKDKWPALIDQLQLEYDAAVCVTSGPDPWEMRFGQAIISSCRTQVYSHLGDLDLGQLAALMREADLFLGVDTAPMHMAAAVGTPVVAIFGPSRDAVWAPWGPEHRIVRKPCPCLESGRRLCDEASGMNCLKYLSAAEVYRATRESLNFIAAAKPDGAPASHPTRTGRLVWSR